MTAGPNRLGGVAAAVGVYSMSSVILARPDFAGDAATIWRFLAATVIGLTLVAVPSARWRWLVAAVFALFVLLLTVPAHIAPAWLIIPVIALGATTAAGTAATWGPAGMFAGIIAAVALPPRQLSFGFVAFGAPHNVVTISLHDIIPLAALIITVLLLLSAAAVDRAEALALIPHRRQTTDTLAIIVACIVAAVATAAAGLGPQLDWRTWILLVAAALVMAVALAATARRESHALEAIVAAIVVLFCLVLRKWGPPDSVLNTHIGPLVAVTAAAVLAGLLTRSEVPFYRPVVIPAVLAVPVVPLMFARFLTPKFGWTAIMGDDPPSRPQHVVMSLGPALIWPSLVVGLAICALVALVNPRLRAQLNAG